VPGPCASKPAEQAARELVRCGTGRLSFELMVPVSDVALQYNRALVERNAFKLADRRNTPAPAQS
jgi:hypothetical protein